MNVEYGPYSIKTHELDNKLSVQVTSSLGKVFIKPEMDPFPHDFPNGVRFELENGTQPKAKGLKRYTFGDYTFIVGINNVGQLCLHYSEQLYVNQKRINDEDTLTLAFLLNLNN